MFWNHGKYTFHCLVFCSWVSAKLPVSNSLSLSRVVKPPFKVIQVQWLFWIFYLLKLIIWKKCQWKETQSYLRPPLSELRYYKYVPRLLRKDWNISDLEAIIFSSGAILVNWRHINIPQPIYKTSDYIHKLCMCVHISVIYVCVYVRSDKFANLPVCTYIGSTVQIAR